MEVPSGDKHERLDCIDFHFHTLDHKTTTSFNTDTSLQSQINELREITSYVRNRMLSDWTVVTDSIKGLQSRNEEKSTVTDKDECSISDTTPILKDHGNQDGSIRYLRTQLQSLAQLHSGLVQVEKYCPADHARIIMSQTSGWVWLVSGVDKTYDGKGSVTLAEFRGGDTYTSYDDARDLFNKTAREINPRWLKRERAPDERMFHCDSCVSEYRCDVVIGDKCPRCDTGMYQELSEW